jgi:PadR family transcriptional regulator, regulatory protein PadR
MQSTQIEVAGLPRPFSRLTYIARQCMLRPVIDKELVAASTEPLILSLLARGESYGYELIQEVKQLSGHKIHWTDGMLYPVLHRMEDNGWIESRWVEMENGRKRKYYSIKKDGQTALKAKRAQWTLISGVLGGLWKEQHV